jgi:hypothetical protein
MRTNLGNVIKDVTFKNEICDIQVLLIEYVTHRCYKRHDVTYLVSLADYNSGKIQQKEFDNFPAALYKSSDFCVEADKMMKGNTD